VHPKVVEAFLLSPTFTSKLPPGVQLFLRPHYPVLPHGGTSAPAVSALQGEKYTWAIVDERAGTHTAFIVSAAVVDLSITDEEMDALDAATTQGGLSMTLDKGVPVFTVGGDKVTPEDKRYRVLNWVLTGAGIASAAGVKLILSNGPRWVLVSTDSAIAISRSSGRRADDSPLDPHGANTSMFGGLVSQAFENVVTRDAMASLVAAKEAARR
jgi:hypothetical protein